jgi:capsular exopolysaccharide synthesis family protein
MSRFLQALEKGIYALPPQGPAFQGQIAPGGPVAADAIGADPGVPKPKLPDVQACRTVTLHRKPNSPILPFDEASVRAGDQYRILKAKIALLSAKPQVFLVTSAAPGDGKSVTGINFAGALALNSESRVLLVDTDFRWPTVADQLGIPAGPGLAEVLAGTCSLDEAIVRIDQMPNLHILPAGESKVNPVELMDSLAWADLCASLRESFSNVILDTPPVGLVAEYDLIQAQADKVILVARPDHTKRGMFHNALRQVPKDKLIGVVLNCMKDWPLGKVSGYGYYHYHDYGLKPKAPGRRK